jgi:hypothetical protein
MVIIIKILIFISPRPLSYKTHRFRIMEWQKKFMNESIMYSVRGHTVVFDHRVEG